MLHVRQAVVQSTHPKVNHAASFQATFPNDSSSLHRSATVHRFHTGRGIEIFSKLVDRRLAL